jgi:uncharacterized protein
MSSATLPTITILTTAALALLASGLAVWVIVQRVRLKVEWGDGGQTEMARAMRAHANFAEHVPIALLALAACEFAGAPKPLLMGLAAVLVAGRLLSAIGLTRSLGPSLPRQAGASLTIAITAIAAVYVLLVGNGLS